MFRSTMKKGGNKMPNREFHMTLGAVTGSLFSAFEELLSQINNEEHKDDNKFNISWEPLIFKAILGVFLGSIGGILPDLLEPARNPNHRSFFHSWLLLLSMLLVIAFKISKKSTLKGEFFHLFLPLTVGYSSHLLADMTTAKGLPAIK